MIRKLALACVFAVPLALATRVLASGGRNCEAVRSELIRVSSEIGSAGAEAETLCPKVNDFMPLGEYVSKAISLCRGAASLECGDEQESRLNMCNEILGLLRSIPKTRACGRGF